MSQLYARSGSSTASTFDPSSGGIGTRLNNPRPTDSDAVSTRKENHVPLKLPVVTARRNSPRAISSSKSASRKLDTGPASAVSAMPCLGFLK